MLGPVINIAHHYCFISAKSMLTRNVLLKSGSNNKMYIQKLKVYVVKVALSVCVLVLFYIDRLFSLRFI